MVNYFWLSLDPDESARWYCDQHCFKIGSEVVESVWDAVLTLKPSLSKEADVLGCSKAYRHRRHAKDGELWHPLSVWHCMCRANMKRGLINADAIFKEHQRRTGKSHQAWKDCKFLLGKVDQINFNTKVWKDWYQAQTTPEKRKGWTLEYGFKKHVDRNTCEMTEPVQCINDDLFPGCKVQGDVVRAYRRYYNAKIYSLKVTMRYFYSTPPSWLGGDKRLINGKLYIYPYLLDEEGYVVVD